ncbi:MAG TPA: hypothetical protein VLK89_08875 [Solirubrobacterales bacterium]|nr:hypothetical protein [Solirubrobacterales bacterium]
MSRTRFLYALAAVVALIAMAAALAACGGGSGKSGEDPQTVVDEATLQGIESGNLDLSLGVKAQGSEGGNVDVSLSGPFQGEGTGKLPQLDMTAKANGSINGSDVDFEGGLVLLPNSAYVNYQGTEYEVDPTTFSFVESALQQAQRESGAENGSAGAAACQEEVGKLKVGSFIENATNEGSADVGGTSTTKISGDLDVPGAIDSVLEVVEGPACKAQIAAAGPLPSKSEIEEAKSQVKEDVKGAHVDIYVGDDNIVRRIVAQLKIEPKQGGGGPKSVEIDLDLQLTEVNEEQEISAPGNAKPLNDLFLKLGVNPIELLGLLNGEGGEGLGNLLEGLGETAGGGSSGGGGSGGSQQAYLQCLGNARSPVDLQKCAQLQ